MVRPMLLTYIDDLIKAHQSFHRTSDIYGELVRSWIERETKRVPEAQKVRFRQDLETFSRLVAKDLYQKRADRKGKLIIPEAEILPLARQHGVQLEDLEMKSRSLLNRNADGDYKFSHKSILEYFLALQAQEDCAFYYSLDFDVMDMARKFCDEMGKWPEMIRIPGDSFIMGRAESYDVTLDSFEIGKYPVTQRQWKAIMGDNPSYFKGDDLPVENLPRGAGIFIFRGSMNKRVSTFDCPRRQSGNTPPEAAASHGQAHFTKTG